VFWRREKQDEDPFAALRDGSTYQSEPTTFTGLGSTGLESNGLPSSGLGSSGLGSSGLGSSGLFPDGQPGKVPVRPNRVTATTRSVTTSPRPASSPASPAGPRRSGRSTRTATRRTSNRARFVVFAIVFAVVAINVVRSIHISSGGSAISTTFEPPSTSSPAPAPAHANSVSYLTPNGLRAGLAEVKKAAPGAGLTLLRLDARSFIAETALRDGSGKEVSLGPSGTLVFTITATGAHPVPLSAIKPNAMGRLTAELRRHFHLRPDQIDYMVLDSAPPTPPEWFIFTKVRSPQHLSANLSGGDLTATS
jgi:hypothetical protein